MKTLLKRLLNRTPYRVVRASARNRFLAQQETLLTLSQRGYRPQRIVDGGANVGEFARMARSVFPDARIDLIEPQPSCQAALTAFARASDGVMLHAVAVGREEGTLAMAFDPSVPSTGAHIVIADESGSEAVQSVPVQTLNSILTGIARQDRTFLKLDLQGWELEALHGALAVLPAIEVILTEVSFYAQAYEPPIAKLISFLAENDFILYDIASLAARRRDNRAHQADFVFVRNDCALAADKAWG